MEAERYVRGNLGLGATVSRTDAEGEPPFSGADLCGGRVFMV